MEEGKLGQSFEGKTSDPQVKKGRGEGSNRSKRNAKENAAL